MGGWGKAPLHSAPFEDGQQPCLSGSPPGRSHP